MSDDAVGGRRRRSCDGVAIDLPAGEKFDHQLPQGLLVYSYVVDCFASSWTGSICLRTQSVTGLL